MAKIKSKTCQNCKSKFTIEPEDFAFYKKIDVPEPTFCPDCRNQRRTVLRNEMNLYKRKCDYSGKEIISIYRPDGPFKVYQSKIWHSDKWDPMDYGKDYDFNQSFFDQFYQLSLKIPWPHVFFDINNVNCEYCSGVFNSKNCYRSICNNCEDCAFVVAGKCNNCIDSYWVLRSENCYENLDAFNNYNVYFSQYADNCIDSSFLYNCRNCQNCFGCVNLKNKKYHIFNKPYSKEEYQKEIKKYDLGDFENIERIKKKFSQFKLKLPHKFAFILKSINCSGDNIRNSKDCLYCFSTGDFEGKTGAENCKYIFSGGNNLKDSYDLYDAGTNAALLYDSTTIGVNSKNIYFSMNITHDAFNVEYSNNCRSVNDLFGCIGLSHKKYCILNKQYTKKEYEELVPKIKQHMDDMSYTDKKGRIYKYGEFFPIEMSPFSYNEAISQDHHPLTKKEALEQGYTWHDRPKSEYKATIKAKDLSNHIKDIKKDILKEVIECGNGFKCSGIGVFRLIPMEYEFYKKHNIALPRLCPDCRHRIRFNKRNPMKLWQRKCQCAGHQDDSKIYQNQLEHPHHKDKHCPNEFQTSYSLDRKEIVYCEACYNKEVE